MNSEEKTKRLRYLFEEQKLILSKINFSNFIESTKKIRSLELQKEIIKAIPNYKK
jgi:hypothetical protein